MYKIEYKVTATVCLNRTVADLYLNKNLFC